MAESVISAAQVKALREETGLGMMECKKALVECAGDFEKAKDWLRVKSGAKADKVAARSAAEGRVAFAANGAAGALAEISCETDFVARDENIGAFAGAVAKAVAQAGADSGAAPDGSDALAALTLENGDTAEQMRKNMVMKLGENITIRRAALLRAEDGEAVYHYIHSGDKIGAMCRLEGGDEALGRDICMHIAAMRPRYLNAESVPEDVIAREREVFISQVKESGKPAEMADKIAAGKLNKWYDEITLARQAFVKDGDKKVSQVLDEAGARVMGFALFVVGASD